MKKQLPLLIGLLFFIYTPRVFAVAVTLSNVPSEITTDPFTLNVSISGAGAGTNYLRIDLYKDGTQNYFGETFGASGWYGESDYTQYFPITIVSGQTWNGQVQGRVGSPKVTQYDSTGLYKLRLRRYTSSGNNPSGEADTTATTVAIVVPTITPTPTDIPTPTITPKPPTATPTLRPTNTPTPTPKPTIKLATPTTVISDIENSPSQGVLADALTPTEEPSPTTVVLGAQTKRSSVGTVFFIIGGILFSICGILLFRQYWLSRDHESDNSN